MTPGRRALLCKYPRQLKGGQYVPCGQCAKCIDYVDWTRAARIIIETRASERTWWLTLTFAQEPSSEAVGYASVQKFLKRLRKSGYPLRYAFVAEWGTEKGRLHFHALVHCGDALTKRVLQAEWPDGFSNCKLVKGTVTRGPHAGKRSGATAARLAEYISAYVSKGGSGRFRFSQGYGSKQVRFDENEAVRAVLAAFPEATLKRVGLSGVKRFRRLPKRVLRPALKRLGLEDGSSLPRFQPLPDDLIAAQREHRRQFGFKHRFEPDASWAAIEQGWEA